MRAPALKLDDDHREPPPGAPRTRTRPRARPQARAYRLAVPVVLAVLALITLAVLVLAGGVLLGVLPYPGR